MIKENGLKTEIKSKLIIPPEITKLDVIQEEIIPSSTDKKSEEVEFLEEEVVSTAEEIPVEEEVLQEEEEVVTTPEEQPNELKPPEPQIVKCPFCGTVKTKGMRFCPQCGRKFKKK